MGSVTFNTRKILVSFHRLTGLMYIYDTLPNHKYYATTGCDMTNIGVRPSFRPDILGDLNSYQNIKY
jgi:hypothetical protein